jgi:hypothetical protein
MTEKIKISEIEYKRIADRLREDYVTEWSKISDEFHSMFKKEINRHERAREHLKIKKEEALKKAYQEIVLNQLEKYEVEKA